MLHDELRQEFIRRGMPADADDAAAAAWIADKYPCIDRLTRFFRIVYGESDRGCVICATAFIDDALATAIRLALKEMAEPPKRILDALLTKQPLPPLGSFAIRTKMARALGLIDDHTMAALDAMRPMRNDAAHISVKFRFDNPEYNIQALLPPLSKDEQYCLKMLHRAHEQEPDRFPLRRVFEDAACSIFYRLNLVAEFPLCFLGLRKPQTPMGGPFDERYQQRSFRLSRG